MCPPMLTPAVHPQQGRVSAYRRKILPHFPALFHKWFINNFSDPTQWFESRYVATVRDRRSCAPADQ